LTHLHSRALVLLAAAWFQRASAADPAAQPAPAEVLVAQALQFEHGEGVKRDAVWAAGLYCDAARMGSAEAYFRLGWMYATGRGIERDDGYAVALFQRAADLDHEYAKRMLRLIRSDHARLPDCLAGPNLMASVAAIAENPTGSTQGGSTQKSDSPDDPGTAIDRTKISAALTDWADAWSRRDFDNYLAAYARDFSTGDGRTWSQWREERRARIANKSWINVKISALEVSVEGTFATARFRQDYQSDRLHESGTKTLGLVKSDGKWLIRREQSVN
jgi:ketosteroid isomerase-like protein